MDFSKFNSQMAYYLASDNWDINPADYEALQGKLAMIEQMSEVQNTSVIVFDFFKQDYAFRQIRFSDKLGHNQDMAGEAGLAYFVSLLHPDDFPVILHTYKKAFSFLADLPPEEKKDYKLNYTFRSRGKDGHYYTLVDQVVVLELDRKGNIWLLLGITDMLPSQKKINGATRQFVNLKNKMIYLFNDNEDDVRRPVLSSREIEVLGLVSKGFASKKIAEQLFISVNTVNNHRQHILEKTNTSNTAEAVAYARELGFV